jgi:hypothetical protein
MVTLVEEIAVLALSIFVLCLFLVAFLVWFRMGQPCPRWFSGSEDYYQQPEMFLRKYPNRHLWETTEDDDLDLEYYDDEVSFTEASKQTSQSEPCVGTMDQKEVSRTTGFIVASVSSLSGALSSSKHNRAIEASIEPDDEESEIKRDSEEGVV